MPIENVLIAGEPVLVDEDGRLQAWLNKLLAAPIEDPFFSPTPFLPLRSGGDRFNNDLFKSALPELPPIRIGSLQWPCVGVSRFARGLFVVDTNALGQIAKAAWGSQVVTTPPEEVEEGAPPFKPQLIEPEAWTKNANNAVDVEIIPNISPTDTLKTKMYVLPPIRISKDAWLVRLVDQRYFQANQLGPIFDLNKLLPLNTWDNLFAAMLPRGYRVDYVAESGSLFGNPDPCFANSNAPIPLLVDAACFSVGCRPVVPFKQPDFPEIAVNCELPPAATTKRGALANLVSSLGGSSTIVDKPSRIEFRCPSPWSYYIGHRKDYSYTVLLPGHGESLSTHLVINRHLQLDSSAYHTINTPASFFVAYTTAIAAKLQENGGWNQLEHSVTLPGIQEIDPSGHDDYIEWEWSASGAVTRIKSLPNSFFPYALLAQDPASIEALSAPCPWFATAKDQTNGIALTGNVAGIYSTGQKAWAPVFIDVQIVDNALAIGGPSATFRPATVKALIASQTTVPIGESVEMHFCDIPIAASESSTQMFTGWVIRRVRSRMLDFVRFTLKEDLAPFGEADADINSAGPDDGADIVVHDWVGKSGTTGQKGIAWYDGFTYRVVEILSEDSTAFVLTADATWGAFNAMQSVAAVVLKPDGSTGEAITVKTIGRTRAKSGSRGTAFKIGTEWIVTEIQQPALHVRGKLAARLDKYASTIDVDDLSVLSPYPNDIPPPTDSESGHKLNVDNPKNLYGFDNAIVDLGYKSETGRYFIDSIERQAFRVRGLVKTAFTEAETTAVIHALYGIDGKVAPEFLTSEGIEAENSHEWAGHVDADARAEFNWELGQWELYQVDCHIPGGS